MNRTHVGEDEQGHDQRDEVQEEKESATHALKELVMSLRATSKPANRNGSIRTCEGRGVFVYELPAKFNKELLYQCEDLVENMCQFFDNNGTGSPIPELGLRWFNTHLYSLEPIFHSRALKHPCRVYKPEDAKLFFVPFYGGIDILRWHFKNVSNEVKDGLGLELLNWLEPQDLWRRNAGKDHVFVFGKISWDFRRQTNSSWGSNLLERDQMQNPIKLLIERKPWHPNDIGVPHPTFFHPNSDADIAGHQSKLAASNRHHLVAFAGADRPGSSASIRSALIQQCKFSNGHCRFLDCLAIDCRRRPTPIIELFSTSEFCLQPPGDSPTRKSVFDSLVSGCIPVLFDPFTAYYQYPWHLPEDYTKYSVYIDQESVRSNSVQVVEMLSKISVEKREEMRRFIIYELMPGLVYGGADASFEKFDDAFSVSINNLFDLIKGRDG